MLEAIREDAELAGLGGRRRRGRDLEVVVPLGDS